MFITSCSGIFSSLSGNLNGRPSRICEGFLLVLILLVTFSIDKGVGLLHSSAVVWTEGWLGDGTVECVGYACCGGGSLFAAGVGVGRVGAWLADQRH